MRAFKSIVPVTMLMLSVLIVQGYATQFNGGHTLVYTQKAQLLDPGELNLVLHMRGYAKRIADAGYIMFDGTGAVSAHFGFSKLMELGVTMILYQDLSAVIDSMGLCIFTIFALNPEHYANLLSSVTGEPMDGRQLLALGERIWNMERLFNLRDGYARKDDSLPPRFSQETLPRGHSKNQVVDLEPLLEEYYRLRAWDADGVPTKAKLEELGLEV